MPITDKHRKCILAAAVAIAAVPAARAQAPQQTGQQQLPPLKFKFDFNEMRAKYANAVPGFTQGPRPPADFPLPVYTSNQQTAYFFTTTASKTPTESATIVTTDQPVQAYGWYKQWLGGNGWTIANQPQSPAEKAGQVFVLTAKKGDLQVSITAVRQKRGNGTLINLTSMKVGS